jgi:DNA-binding winged helix-turn-helix (wHTH) protein
VLVCLMQQPGQSVPTRELHARVFRTTRTGSGSHVRRQIMELRRRLGDAGALIATTRTGYCLRGPSATTEALDGSEEHQ